ncbi:MAG: pyridoxamine 5'-phosphate oxidase family protein [Syntrophomonadaceae bacterium]|jgi:nitroimidazol reductase NimA-like FMN-containing flavoprotein (pyridoxamine 5'-phosphate oxidase superfamily)
MPKKWMKDKAEIEKVLEETDFGFLGMSNQGKPYVVPMSFAYKDNKIYLHAALKGLKIEYLRNNPEVCFTVATLNELIQNHNDLCDYSLRYRSVIARGKARLLSDLDEKITALTILGRKYAQGTLSSGVDRQKAEVTAVIVIEIEEMTGKYNVSA